MRVLRVAALLALAFSLVCSAWAHNDLRPVIVLPQKLVAGLPATLAVLDAQGRLTPGVVLEFSGGERVTTDATGRARFTAPAEQGVVMVELASWPGESPGKLRASSVVVPLPAGLPEGVRITELPRVINITERFTVAGSGFDSHADGNQVTLGGQPAAVLAASPLALVVVPSPRAAAGAAAFALEIGQSKHGPEPVTLVALEIEGPPSSIRPRNKVRVSVRLRGTELPMEIILHNLTPEIVQLPDGDNQRLFTRGGAENLAAVELKGRREGEYSLSARLVPLAAGLPDTQAARRELEAARKAAPQAWRKLIARLIRHLDQHPEHALDVRNELEKLLGQAPAGEYGRRLEAAWRILLKLP